MLNFAFENFPFSLDGVISFLAFLKSDSFSDFEYKRRHYELIICLGAGL